MVFYDFQNATAFDPYTREGAPNATGSVFSLGDTAFANPLAVTLMSSGLQAIELTTDQYSQLPGFQVADLVQVVFKSGDFAKVLNTTTPLVGPAGPAVADAVDNGDGTVTFTLPDGSPAATVVLPVSTTPGPEGPEGPRGLPGVNAVPAADAVATYATTPGNPVNTALNATTARVVRSAAGTDMRISDPSSFTPGTGTATTWETPDGTGVVVHPSVRFFPGGWNGYQWWAAATPYANTDASLENPCIYHSEDGINFVEPEGVTNPLYPQPANGTGFNSDTHLMQGPDGLLYMAWREQIYGIEGRFRLTHSADGVNWSDSVAILTFPNDVRRPVSPCIWYDGGQWVLICVDTLPEPPDRVINRFTAPAPYGPWTFDSVVTIDPAWTGDRSPWHIDAMLIGSQVVMTVQDGIADGGSGPVYLCVSEDNGRTFTRATPPLISTDSYRTCFLPVATENGLALDVWHGKPGPNWGVDYLRAPAVNPAIAELKAEQTAMESDLLVIKANTGTPTGWTVFDTFDRADAATLGTASTGQAWAEAATFRIEGGKAAPVAATHSRPNIDTGSADVEITVEVHSPAAREVMVLARFIDVSNHWRFGIRTSNTYVFEKIIGGAATTSLVLPGRTYAGGEVTLGIRAVGNQLTAYIDGVAVHTHTDPAPGTETRAGVLARFTDSFVDNFRARPAAV